MAIPVLVMGPSGSGKTYSLKNFKPDEVGVISVEKGRLPFKSDINPSRFESRAGFFASTRDECLSPRVCLECSPEIPVAPGLSIDLNREYRLC